MPRERPTYRDNLEDILAFTGGKRILTINDVRQYTGLVDIRTIKRHFPIQKGVIAAATLARCLAGGETDD